ncbi:MAG: dihydrofolate reductase [Holosporaceae bacterium]|jgi:dihydrofolate reductase|nr:dihydrofolate reductase [Holosporaceae bacterium]
MVKLIAIVDADVGIAKSGKIPWQFREDLKFFRQKTQHNVIIMGWKTYFSIEKSPLPNRINCVVSGSIHPSTSSQQLDNPHIEIFQTPEQGLEKYRNRDIWIIGGAVLFNYMLTKQLVSQAFITQVHRSYDADLFINKSLLMSNFSKIRTIACGLTSSVIRSIASLQAESRHIKKDENDFPGILGDGINDTIAYSIYEYNL